MPSNRRGARARELRPKLRRPTVGPGPPPLRRPCPEGRDEQGLRKAARAAGPRAIEAAKAAAEPPPRLRTRLLAAPSAALGRAARAAPAAPFPWPGSAAGAALRGGARRAGGERGGGAGPAWRRRGRVGFPCAALISVVMEGRPLGAASQRRRGLAAAAGR